MANAVDSESEGDNSTPPRPSVAPRTTGILTNPIDPNEIDSDTILSKRINKKPSHQGQQLPEILLVKIQKVTPLAYNAIEPLGGDRIQLAEIEIKKYNAIKRLDYSLPFFTRPIPYPNPYENSRRRLRRASCSGSRDSYREGREGRSGYSDKTNTKDKDATISESNNNNTSITVKKKRRGLYKQPPNGKDIYKYKDENNTIYGFCGFGLYLAKRYIYLSSNLPTIWELNIIVATAKAINRRNNWLLDTGSDKTLTYDIEDFYIYQIDCPEDAYIYKDYSGNRVITLGYSEVIVRAELPDRGEYIFITTSYYTLGGYRKLFSIQKLLKDKGDILGYIDTTTGVLYLVSLKDNNVDTNSINLDLDDEDDIGYINQMRFDDPNKASLDLNNYDPNDIGYDPNEIVDNPYRILCDLDDFDLENIIESKDDNTGLVNKVIAYDIYYCLRYIGKNNLATKSNIGLNSLTVIPISLAN
ncbi:hypothetical protein N7527_005653 [Penicillium freii]|nr:hypothetical protein N7527_005653 [Penicillium freii]